jgi:hypothetical protein
LIPIAETQRSVSISLIALTAEALASNSVLAIPAFSELNMTGPRRLALQGWVVIGLLVLILLGIVGVGVEIKVVPYLWRGDAPNADLDR